MKDSLTNAVETATVDYSVTTSRFERRNTTALMRLLFGKMPFTLDFGDGDLRPMARDTPSKFTLAPPRFRTLLWVLVNPGLRFGEAYMEGSWHLKDGKLADMLLMMLTFKGGRSRRNGLSFGLTEAITHFYKQFLATFSATRKVQGHYDESTAFFELMMGRDLVYTCAFYDDDPKDLHEAQQIKFDTIFDRLRLREAEDLNILDIGSGWGSFENFFPADLKADIDGISLSGVQVDYATRRWAEGKKTGRPNVTYIQEDYRTYCHRHEKKYNRIISIGMLEAVGRSKYKHYFQAIDHVLADGGVALIHSIVKHQPGATNLWVDRYIFQGGYSPQVSEVVAGIEAAGLKTQAVHFHHGGNYIKTLQAWLKNIEDKKAKCIDVLVAEQTEGTEVEKQKRARTTFRMYEFFLSGVQTMFHPDYLGNGIAHFIVTR